jgi:hypothetical protein
MKKILYMFIGAAIAILALGVAGFAYAQAQNPPVPRPPAVDGTTNSGQVWACCVAGCTTRWNLA